MNKNIIIFVLFILILGGVFFIFKDDIIKDKEHKHKVEHEPIVEYFVYGIDTVIHYNDGEWEFLEPEDVQWKKFEVFDGDDYMGNYSLQFNKKWYVFDDERLSQKYNSQIFAYSGKRYINLHTDYEEYSDNDIVELNDILITENIVDYGKLTYAKKISLDLNTTIYVATNIYTEEETENIFSVVYLKKDNEITMLDHFYGSRDEELLMPSYYFEKVFDLDDNVYRLVLLKTYFGNSSNDCHIMYEIENGSSKKVLDCDKIYSEEKKFEIVEEKQQDKKFPTYVFYIIGVFVFAIVAFAGFVFMKNIKENRI